MHRLSEKTNGFMGGICHFESESALLHDLGLGWTRLDVPYPTEDRYAPFLRMIADYYEHGIRAVLISPYPSAFIRDNIDPTSPQGLREVEKICEKMAADFAPYQPCWQATNEMHMAHFRVPLTETQAVDFLISSIKGLRRGDPDAAVGHNSVEDAWLENAKRIERAVGGSDYIGLDLYAGTWVPGDENTYIEAIDNLYAALKRPVILMEFGFASVGDCMKEDKSDIDEFLREWGFPGGRADIPDNLERVIEKLPPKLRNIVYNAAPAERLFTVQQEFFTHILKKWPCPGGLPHTEEGQAEFYAGLLPKLLAHPHLGGAMLYCMQDYKRCFLCGEADCPLEIAWGLLRTDGSKKPAYATVKRIFNT